MGPADGEESRVRAGEAIDVGDDEVNPLPKRVCLRSGKTKRRVSLGPHDGADPQDRVAEVGPGELGATKEESIGKGEGGSESDAVR